MILDFIIYLELVTIVVVSHQGRLTSPIKVSESSEEWKYLDH